MLFQKGQPSWNKGTKGVMKPNKTSFKKGSKARLGAKLSEETKRKIGAKSVGRVHSEESKRKTREALMGAKCYRWKGGISPLRTKIRTSLEYRLWRKSVFERDNFTCQKSGKRGGDLVAHHINNFSEFPELRFAIDNGMTLSEKAHKEFHKKYGIKNNTREQLEEFLCQR